MSQTTTPREIKPQIVQLFDQFYREYYRDDIGQLAEAFPSTRSLYIDFMDLYKFDHSLADDWLKEPEEIRKNAEKALAEFDLPIDVPLADANVRLTGLNDAETIGIPQLKSRHIGQYLGITGNISHVSPDVPRPETAAYKCLRCDTITKVPQHTSSLQEPNECAGCERKGPFTLDGDATEWEDRQMIKITQPPEETKTGQGPSIEVLLRDDAVEPLGDGRLTPGSRVTINGVYTIQQDDGLDDYVEGRAVSIEDTDYSAIDITQDDIDRIHRVAAGEEGDPYQLFPDSLAPTHYGDDLKKLAVVLQLFRGLRSQQPDGSWQRGDIHILFIGDPAVGKSDLLDRAAKISPRSAQTSGKGASAAGLTASAVPSEFGDEKWTVEAGVLVHADNGLACVDELDKVDEEAVSSMHDALEGEQTVKFAKAGIKTQLPARSSLLAAGNPDYGRFDRTMSVIEQVDIPPTLLSRFDLMFTMMDDPDRDEDELIAENMVRDRQATHAHHHDDGSDTDAAIDPPLEHDFMRKYIAYARRNCQPRLDPYKDEEVLNHLVSLFIELRKPVHADDQEAVPVTRRKIQGLQRLAEASARVRLSDRVEKQDVERAAELVLASMRELGTNEEGMFDADIVETGASKPQQDAIKTVEGLIEEHEDEYEDGIPMQELKELVADFDGLEWDRVEYEVEKLKQKGELYEPARNHIRHT